MPGQRALFSFSGFLHDNVYVHVVDKMEEYDADKVTQTMSMTVIENLVAGLDRTELLEPINLA